MRSLIAIQIVCIGSINSVNHLVRSIDPNQLQADRIENTTNLDFNLLYVTITNSDLLMGIEPKVSCR